VLPYKDRGGEGMVKTLNITKLTKVLRSKNAKAFKLTFDIIFNDRETYEKVKKTGTITKELITKLYRIPMDKITRFVWYDAGNALKITIMRPWPSGSIGESDIYGCQQHVPLMSIEIPWK
jgi:hypothetical protein